MGKQEAHFIYTESKKFIVNVTGILALI